MREQQTIATPKRDIRAELRRMVSVSDSASLDELTRMCSSLYSSLAIGTVSTCADAVSPGLLDRVCVLASGSLSSCSMVPGSDLDLVLLATHDAHPAVSQLRDLLVCTLHSHAVPNVDCVVVTTRDKRCEFPVDMVDQRIAETGTYLTGNTALYEDYITHTSAPLHSLLDLFICHSLARQRDAAWCCGPAPSIKHSRGGLRDIMRVEQYLWCLGQERRASQDLLLRLDAQRAPVEQWHRLLSWRTIEPMLMEESADVYSSSAMAACQRISSLYDEAEALVLLSLPKPISNAFRRLQDLRSQGGVLSWSDILRLAEPGSHRSLAALGVSLLGEMGESTFSDVASAFGWLGLAALLTNPRTPGSVLHHVAAMEGYEWRNLRDQVPKHHNVEIRTLELLMRSNLPFTRTRAEKMLSQRTNASEREN